jgi:iron(III) transport system substrate-binding protein
MGTHSVDEQSGRLMEAGLSRRELIRGLMALGLSAPAVGALIGRPSHAGAAAPSAGGADVEAARKEGKVVFWHAEQEADVVKFAKLFSDKYGIKTEWERLLPGKAMPKLEAGLKSDTLDLDVWWVSDAGIMYDQQKKGRLLQYVSPFDKDYAPGFKSNPEGYWTTYFINVGTIMYSPKFVKKEEAPKTWMDLLDPKWKGQIGFQDSTAGSQYAWWYLMREVMPKDYFDRLTQNKPRAYNSSTQLMDDVQRGETKIGGKVSIFQYVKALRAKQPVEMVLPPEGVPNNIQVVAILASTKRPNAAKLLVDYLLSREGQQAWNEIQGSYSALKDVNIEGLPKLSSLKLLQPKDLADYASAARHQEFVQQWNQVTGFK